MTPKKIALIGSTGSIGCSTLDVVRAHPGSFDVQVLAAHSNVELLVEQVRQFRPDYVGLVDLTRRDELKTQLKDSSVRFAFGEDEIIKLASLPDVDIVVNSVVGAAGLLTSIEAMKAGKALALANKESLVAGGPLFTPLIEKYGGKILPIDSEHSAIWQSAMAGKEEEIRNIIITASGGPFRELPADQFASITPEQALAHPTWKMGRKISIDSATLANKGLEVIEAVVLFHLPVRKVKVVVHPQSIVHSMVEFIDSSVIAQLSSPDMRLPITYALFWPKRVESAFGQLDLASMGSLTFEPPDLEKFPALQIAYDVADTGGTAPALFNAANEIAVEAFLGGSIKFTEITDTIKSVIDQAEVVASPDLDDVLEADRTARRLAGEKVGKIECY